MTLRKYLEDLASLIEQDERILDLPLVASSDDEGNSYNPVYYTPTLGYFNLEDKNFNPEDNNPNAICIN